MKKKVTRKDFYMEIRRSPGRFLSILFIVIIQVKNCSLTAENLTVWRLFTLSDKQMVCQGTYD